MYKFHCPVRGTETKGMGSAVDPGKQEYGQCGAGPEARDWATVLVRVYCVSGSENGSLHDILPRVQELVVLDSRSRDCVSDLLKQNSWNTLKKREPAT